MSEGEKNSVRSVVTAFEVLTALVELNGAGVTELASHLEIPKSTLHNYLSTLEQQEFLVKDGTTYRVGIQFLELGAFARTQYPLYKIARPEVNHLAEETGELANLLIEEQGWGYYLYRARGDEAVNAGARVGTQIYLHCSALGKAILAHMPEERVDEIIDRRGLPSLTENTATDRDELSEELDEIRNRGYAIDDEEHHDGLRCIAVPVLSSGDRVLGAISVAGPSNRMKGDQFAEEIPSLLKERVNVVELNITYS